MNKVTFEDIVMCDNAYLDIHDLGSANLHLNTAKHKLGFVLSDNTRNYKW